jgi:hypothetical protein
MNAMQLVVFGIVAVAMLAIFAYVITPAAPNSVEMIKNSLKDAIIPGNMGKTISLGALPYPKNSTVSKEDLIYLQMSIAIECTSSRDCCARNADLGGKKCDKVLSWDYDHVTIATDKKIDTYVRCITEKEYPVCRVYFGSAPAQAKIDFITKPVETQNGEINLTVTIKNLGAVPAPIGENSLVLLKKINGDWKESDYDSNSKETPSVMPGEKQIMYWTISPKNIGEYRAQFRYSALDSGFDTKSVDFNRAVMTQCARTEGTTTIFNPESQKFWEIHNCDNCNYSFECVSAWANYTKKEFIGIDATSAYCLKDTESGSC